MPSARSILIRKIFEIRDNARMSAEQFQAMKLAKFRQLVRHASASSPYYAQLIRERNIDIERCTPADFPPLTKAILMAEFDRIVTDRRITKRAIADFLIPRGPRARSDTSCIRRRIGHEAVRRPCGRGAVATACNGVAGSPGSGSPTTGRSADTSRASR